MSYEISLMVKVVDTAEVDNRVVVGTEAAEVDNKVAVETVGVLATADIQYSAVATAETVVVVQIQTAQAVVVDSIET
jgi:hypothetical protein